MSIEIFIAMLGLLVGFYAIAPETVKARMSAFINPLLFKISIPTYIIILLGVYYLDKQVTSPLAKVGVFWVQYALYIFLFIGCWYVYSVLSRRKLTKNNIVRYYRYLKVLLSKKEYPILIEMLYGSLTGILGFYNNKEKKNKCNAKQLVVKIGAESFSMPSHLKDSFEAEVSQKIFRDVIFNEDFINANVHYGKQFAINLIRSSRLENIRINDYSDKFLYELLNNRDSFLYSEIKETFITCYPDNDELSRFPFLQALFEDIKYCDDQGFYRGIGEYVLEFIDRNIDNNNEKYSRNVHYYWRSTERDERYRCPIFMGLSFFRCMVNKGIRDDLNSHLWLLYLNSWVDSICSKVKYYPEEWQGSKEFPIIYYYLLYELLHVHRDWIDHIYEVNTEEALGSHYQQFDKTINITEGRLTILKWVLEDLLYCADSIARCKEIPIEKRVYLIEVFMEINIGVKSNFSKYGKANIAIAVNVDKVIEEYLMQFKQRIERTNYADIFNKEFLEVCARALNRIDTIPLDRSAVTFWKEWLSGLTMEENKG